MVNELGDDWSDFDHHLNRTLPYSPDDDLGVGNQTIEIEENPRHIFPYNNTMHGANTTNLYAHGLRLGPGVNSPMLTIKPGDSHTYIWQLRADHAPGVHWYYPAHPGSSALQLMNGLTGAIIMAPEPNNKDRRYPVSLKNARFLLMYVTKLILDPETDANGHVTQGCRAGWSCNPSYQSPDCTGKRQENRWERFG